MNKKNLFILFFLKKIKMEIESEILEEPKIFKVISSITYNLEKKRQRILTENEIILSDNFKKMKIDDEFPEINDEHEIPKQIPFIVKINGVAFKNFTKDFKKHDELIASSMLATLNDLTYKFNVTLGFFKEDKIYLIFNTSPSKKHIFGGNIQKICSCLASYCAMRFNHHLKFFINKAITELNQNYTLDELKLILNSVNQDYKYFSCKLLILHIDNLFENKYIKLILKNFNENKIDPNILVSDNIRYGIFSKSIITKDIKIEENNALSDNSYDKNFEIVNTKKIIKIIDILLTPDNILDSISKLSDSGEEFNNLNKITENFSITDVITFERQN